MAAQEAAARNSDASGGSGATSDGQQGQQSHQQGHQQGQRRRRRLWPYFVGIPLGLVSAKITWALLPLYLQEPVVDSDKVRMMMLKSRSEKTVAGWAWLISEASDRLIRDVATAVSVVWDYYRNGPKTEDWTDIHARSAKKVLKLCETNKAVYIKLGQTAAQLSYLLPAPYVETLAVLTHAAPQDSFEQVKRVFHEEFGKEIEDCFESIDPKPIASASLAQVHIGTLKGTGERVAVKVQHSGLRETSDADILLISALMHIVKALFPRFDYVWLAEETEANLPKELNFLLEIQNMERTAAAFKREGRKDIVCPRAHHELSSERVLVMSFEPGAYVNDKRKIKELGLDPADVARLVSEAFAQMVFVEGFVHADTHQSNVAVRCMPGTGPGTGKQAKPQLVLYDHGLYRDISSIRLHWAKLWKSIVTADQEGMKDAAQRMNAGELWQLLACMITTKSWDKIIGVEGEDEATAPSVDDATRVEGLRVTGKAEDKNETSKYAKEYADEVGVILRRLPRETLLLLKAQDCTRNLDIALGAPVNTLVVTARYAQRAINAERLAMSGGGVLVRLHNFYETALLEAGMSTLSAVSTLYRWLLPKKKAVIKEEERLRPPTGLETAK